MKKIFALIVAATIGLSSAADTATTQTEPAQTAQAAKKHVKKHTKAAAATPAA